MTILYRLEDRILYISLDFYVSFVNLHKLIGYSVSLHYRLGVVF